MDRDELPDPLPRPVPEQASASGPWGGPTCGHRGAPTECEPGGQVCGLFMEGHPLHGLIFGAVGTVAPPVDLWLDERRRLPARMGAVPKGVDGQP